MFEDMDRNKKMIIGAYKKLKSYYYYDKTILYNKARLATWESSEEEMNNRIDGLAEFLTTLEQTPNSDYLHILMKNVSLIPMPKAFEKDIEEKNLLKNVISNQTKISKVNFYIKAPVELLILDAIWMIMISKIAYDQKSLSNNVYANRLKSFQIFNNKFDLYEGIDFTSNRAFYPYFRQYTNWRNNAFIKIKKRYDKGLDSILITLDIKSYYYSVVFDFNSLPELLNNDIRLEGLKPLTNIIKNLYVSYTAEMQKYRGAIPADCKEGQSALPIGLFSSMLLANLYLRRFDNDIEKKLSPAYYGRYVDDIILVIDRIDNMEISVADILQKTLIDNNIIRPEQEDEYTILTHSSLYLQGDKIRCIYFNHNEPDAMVKLLCEASKLKPSMIERELMPDIDLSEKSFDDAAYSIEQHSGALKVRDFLFSSNNYAASLFLNALIRMSKNVDIREKKYSSNIEKQLNQILRFYNCDQAIEYRSAWINIFTLILVNNRYDFFLRFYAQTLSVIERIDALNIDSIDESKIKYIVDCVKSALREQLDLAAAIALATQSFSDAIENLQKEISMRLEYDIYRKNIDEMFKYAKDIRNANLFNNHIMAFPLISYINTNNYNFSLVEIYPKDIASLGYGVSTKLPLDKRKIFLSPRFINFDEICLLCSLIHYPNGGDLFFEKMNDLLSIFYESNNISISLGELQDDYINKAKINVHQLCLPSNKQKNNFFEELKIAIASINLDEKRDIEPAILSPKHGLSPQKKNELYKLLNDAVSNNANMIVFPEFYLPIEWLYELFAFSRKNSIAIISGLRYVTYGKQAYNYISVIQPFESSAGFKYTVPILREKNHYAPAETIELAKHGLLCQDPLKSSTHIINWKNLSYSDLMCYELTDIEYRYILRNKIELLVVPELNLDTNYFSNIVESTTRDLHCFIVQVNTSKYGDSRITGPFKSMFKDIIKIKGGENNVVLLGTIDIKGLKTVRATYKEILKEKQQVAFENQNENADNDNNKEKTKFKNPSAGFDANKEV